MKLALASELAPLRPAMAFEVNLVLITLRGSFFLTLNLTWIQRLQAFLGQEEETEAFLNLTN